MPKKTAREKLKGNNKLPQLKSAPAIWGGGSMLIPHPMTVNDLLKTIPKGQLITIDELRDALANHHGADICCPLTAGLFLNLSAFAAEEDRLEGISPITPYWRYLKKKGELNPKFPGGLAAHQTLLQAEGHQVMTRRNRAFVMDYEQALISP